MRDGRLEQADTPRGLYERPANLFVAAFIGSPAMNLIRGRLEPCVLRRGCHATRAVAGRTLRIHVDARALHFFDPETELAL